MTFMSQIAKTFGASALMALLLVGTNSYAQQAASDPKPKSNPFARAKVLSKNALSITIKHSDRGQKAAYQFASDHCASFGKLAVQSASGTGRGQDTTTTWICQEIPKTTPERSTAEIKSPA